jgi:hypothetical protein
MLTRPKARLVSAPADSEERRTSLDGSRGSWGVSAASTEPSNGKQAEVEPREIEITAPDRLLRATQFYWNEMVNLKALCFYHELYRDVQARWLTRFGFIKAIATSSTIAGWVIWQDYAIIWGAIIAASQLIDALRDVFPHAKSRKSSADLVNTLDGLFNDARVEFERISSGNITPDEAIASWRKLQKFCHSAETKYFPEGLAKKPGLKAEADRQTEAFFNQFYGSDRGDQ